MHFTQPPFLESKKRLFSKRLSNAFLDSGKPVVATAALKSGAFIAGVKRCQGGTLWEVTEKNCDVMPDTVAVWISERLQR